MRPPSARSGNVREGLRSIEYVLDRSGIENGIVLAVQRHRYVEIVNVGCAFIVGVVEGLDAAGAKTVY
jgi:hypothetical protein